MKRVDLLAAAGWVLAALMALMVLVPFLLLAATSLKTIPEVFQNPLGLPGALRLDAYRTLLSDNKLLVFFWNSVYVTVAANILITALALPVSYALSRTAGWWGVALFGLFTAGMMIPTQVNMVPLYLMLARLGLLNSHAGLILTYTGFALSFSVFVLTGFMRTLPISMIEAARIDGASEGRILLHIVTPLSMPAVATVVSFNFVWVWNDLLFPLLFVGKEKMRTLPLALMRFSGEYMTNYPVLFAGVILAMIPMVLIFLFLQRYFVEGLTAGAVKG